MIDHVIIKTYKSKTKAMYKIVLNATFLYLFISDVFKKIF